MVPADEPAEAVEVVLGEDPALAAAVVVGDLSDPIDRDGLIVAVVEDARRELLVFAVLLLDRTVRGDRERLGLVDAAELVVVRLGQRDAVGAGDGCVGRFADAVGIAIRRDRVSEAGLPRSDLLERANRAMQATGLGAETLISTLPQPPRSQPGSDQAEVVNRLLFENLLLEHLVRFCHTLTGKNPELHIAAIQLRAGNDRQSWNADVSVAYWVLTHGK